MALDAKGFPSEEDRVNCPFYFKIGTCRNGDRCNRLHVKPTISPTLLLTHLYPSTQDALTVANDEDWEDETYNRAQEHLEIFYEEIFLELARYGEIEDMVVLDNVTDHMLGHVYVKYFLEEAAERAHTHLTNRFYGGRLIQAEYSPVTDFREARCRAFHETRCARGGLCNFMHIKHIPKAIKRRMVRRMYDEHPDFAGPSALHIDGRRSRSRRRKEADERKAKEKEKGRPTSEERRAMIAEWNRARTGRVQMPPPPPPLPTIAAVA